MHFQNLPFDVRDELHHVLGGHDSRRNRRAQHPGDKYAADDEHAANDDNDNRVGARLHDLKLEQDEHNDGVDREQEGNHGRTSFSSTPEETAVIGLRSAQISAIGQRIGTTTPSQPVAVMAAACGWPRFLAIWPGNCPTVTTRITATARSGANTQNAMMQNASIITAFSSSSEPKRDARDRQRHHNPGGTAQGAGIVTAGKSPAMVVAVVIPAAVAVSTVVVT